MRALIGLGGPCVCDLAYWAGGGGLGLRGRNFLVTMGPMLQKLQPGDYRVSLLSTVAYQENLGCN